METIHSFDSLQETMNASGMNLFYFSRPACGVCTAIKPKVLSLLDGFPEVQSYYVNLDEIPEAAGQLSVLTIPAILGYADGREFLREARYISIDDVAEKIRRPYTMIFGAPPAGE